jgi:hypothetical protein
MITLHHDQNGYAFYWDDNWALPPAQAPSGRSVNNVIVPAVFDTESTSLWSASLPHPGMSAQEFIHLWVIGHPNGTLITHRDQSSKRPFLWDEAYEGAAPANVPPGRGVDPFGYMMSNDVPSVPAFSPPPPPPPPGYAQSLPKPRGGLSDYLPPSLVPPVVKPLVGPSLGLPPQQSLQPPVTKPPVGPNLGPQKPVLTPQDSSPIPVLPQKPPGFTPNQPGQPIQPALPEQITVPASLPAPGNAFVPPESTSLASLLKGVLLFSALTAPAWIPYWFVPGRKRRA